MNQSRRGIKLSPVQIKRLLIILALVAVVLMLRNRVKQQFGREEQQVLSASVTTGSISSSVYGSGLLADEDVEQLEIPNGVDVETLYVSRGGGEGRREPASGLGGAKLRGHCHGRCHGGDRCLG